MTMVWEISVFYLESLEEERCVSMPKEERSKSGREGMLLYSGRDTSPNQAYQMRTT
jgi:hypothetical protein